MGKNERKRMRKGKERKEQKEIHKIPSSKAIDTA